MSRREELLDDLVAELEPVSTPDLRLLVGGWLLLSALYVVVLTHWVGPIRPTALEQLHTHPRFLGEMIIGGLVTAGLAVSAFRAAVPGAVSAAWTLGLSLPGALWVGSFLVGMVTPALEPSMLGKREHCYLETFLYALPPMLAALYWQRRLYPLSPGRSAALAGLAAGAMPALYMQIACMYEPGHILLFHIGPGITVALVAPALLLALRKLRVSRG